MLLLLACYEKFEARFQKKSEKTEAIWKDVCTKIKL